MIECGCGGLGSRVRGEVVWVVECGVRWSR